MNIMKFRSLVFAAFLAIPVASFAQVEFSVGWAPPPLPVYEQPACPVAGYIWTPGYWGPSVGFYGGVNYGYGYTGDGYWGGRWNGNNFQYNTAVTRVNTNVVHNTYVNNSVNKQVNANRASFNGPNGVNAQETA